MSLGTYIGIQRLKDLYTSYETESGRIRMGNIVNDNNNIMQVTLK